MTAPEKVPPTQKRSTIPLLAFVSLAEMASFIQPLRNVMISEMSQTDVTVLALSSQNAIKISMESRPASAEMVNGITQMQMPLSLAMTETLITTMAVLQPARLSQDGSVSRSREA